jgi:DNA polymerase-3 subunit delta'
MVHIPEQSNVLSRALCPWLFGALNRLEQAHAGQRLAHGWLIHGAAGVGKTNLALVFATRLLESLRHGQPDTLTAYAFLEGMRTRYEPRNHHPDLHLVHPDSGKHTIAVEQVRQICETLSLSSYGGTGKVVIIEPAEAMTVSAANALLKTLEEPTSDSYLVLVSHRPGLLPATVRSRCQQLSLRLPDASELADWAGKRPDVADAVTLAAPALSPLQWLEALDGEGIDADEAHRQQLIAVLEERGNPLEIADAWSKGDADHTLAWLVRMLHGLIRLRCVRNGSKLITESADSSLHNAARALSLRTLFQRVEEAERLRRDLTGGINVQLAMRALVLGFAADKGMT